MTELNDTDIFKLLKKKLKVMKANCSICKGTGMIDSEEEGYFRNCPGCTGKIEKYEKGFRAGIPEDLIDVKLTDLQPVLVQNCYKNFSTILSKLEKLITSYQMIIYLSDDIYAFGSSTILALILKELAYKDYDVMHTHYTELYELCFNFGLSTEINTERTKKLEKLKEVHILGISDFGNMNKKFDCSDFAYKKMSEILNIRRMNGLFTVISTERTKVDFYERFAGSITTLFNQYYLSFVVQCHDGKYKHSAITKLNKEDPCLGQAFQEPEGTTTLVKNTSKKMEDKPEEVDDILDNAVKDKGYGRKK